jgi:recombination protein RecA
VKVVKNKVAPPFSVAEFELWFDRGISRLHELFDLGVETGLVAKSGSWYSFGGERLGQGRDKSVESLRASESLSEQLELQLSDAIHPGCAAGDDASGTS